MEKSNNMYKYALGIVFLFVVLIPGYINCLSVPGAHSIMYIRNLPRLERATSYQHSQNIKTPREENYDSSLWRSVKDMWFVKSGIPFQEKKMKHTRRSADFDSVYSWRQNHATYSQPFTGKPYRRLY
ncbi:uncharacterized protein LOC111696476 [Eurytemora carolleeae]|uniref:uncharacterized protein LOC111696476 n=1 Tax=Eurytemora carolleeae TaxID=1294199 RepID=UPI000C790973|nr:uncharacterized protein LOC111696476 [Eurytemora carolleeae]|eukprot:XP_023321852.1 uncharacterized protein LOC111696476 [Eurytemora affinis]